MPVPLSLLLCVGVEVAWGCSNIIVTRGASADGTILIGDNDDSAKRHGLVTRFAAAKHIEGSMRQIFDFETGRHLGEIPQPAHTFNTISHANEHGVVIAETTHGGLSTLRGSAGTVMDYGSLIVTTLQRATSARQAIHTMVNLSNTYGYASSMEGFSIADGSEVWYMELIGKGQWGKGVVWVALRVPDGYVTANANQARITNFLPCDNPDICMTAPDTVSFAKERGFYNGKSEFSFSDVYDPVTVTGARFCEARVWYIFKQIADPRDFNASYYLPYAQGFNLTRRMPLWVRAKVKVSRIKVHQLLSSSYAGTWLDPSTDVGAGPTHSPNRWNSLIWQYEGKQYVNERIVGTQFTAWHFVASVRNTTFPSPMRAVLWWGADDHGIAPKIPLYGGATLVDHTYDDGNCSARVACRKAHGFPGTMTEFSWKSAFWINSAVAKLAYSDRDRMMPIIYAAQAAYQAWVLPLFEEADKQAKSQYDAGADQAGQNTLDNLALKSSAEASKRWTSLWQHLMVAFTDGLTTTHDESNLLCGCKKESPQYSKAWLKKVVKDTGDHYRVPSASCAYIDPDGHCHPRTTDNEDASDIMTDIISKVDIPGVLL